MIFLASPYSHSDSEIRRKRFEAACKVAGMLISEGKLVFSPIAHSHPIATHRNLPLNDAQFWWQMNVTMLNMCSEILVLRIPLWHESKGVRREINFAIDQHIAVNYTPELNLNLTPFKILND